MEPIITGGGILMPPQDYMKAVHETCQKHGALLISDEVICGFWTYRKGIWIYEL
ncbi:aminotransferase class III-fold pyridoxal phosphate-dependent enzyme [Bacillus cereus]